MKKLIAEKVSNVNTDSELEALARAYIQAAHNRKMTQTAAMQLVTKIWRSDIIDVEEKKRLDNLGIPEDSKESKIFQQKANQLLADFPNLVYHKPYHGFKNDERRFTLMIILGIHKYFEKTDSIRSQELLYFVRDYLILNLKDCNVSITTTTIKYAMDHMFSKLCQIGFHTHKNFGDLYEKPDFTRKPFDPENPSAAFIPDSYFNLKDLHEPYEMMKEYGAKRTKLSINIFQLLWFIETFF